MTNDMYKFFHGMTLDTVPAVAHHGKVVTIPADTLLEKAVKVLAENKILAAPVVDPKTNNISGVVSVLDIASFLVQIAPDAAELQANDLRSLKIAGRTMTLVPVVSVIDSRNEYVPLPFKAPASLAVDLMSYGVHRVAVMDEHGQNLLATVSQSDLVKLLLEHLPRGESKIFGAKKLAELGLGQSAPISVRVDEPVLNALAAIAKNRISAVAVVDANGNLVGNFSASDLKGLYQEKFPEFLQPVGKFLEQFSPKSLTPVTVSADITFMEVVQKLASGGEGGKSLHRVYTVDANGKPQGLVSLTDVFKVVRDATL